jgi:hypothetical protein
VARHLRISHAILALLSLWVCGAFIPGPAPDDGDDVLPVLGKVTDMNERPLDSVYVTVDQEGKIFDELQADNRGRFNLRLPIGGFYGVEVARDGYILKRFIVDCRADDPSKVITGPFQAEVSLRPRADLAEVDITELDLPFAYVKYSKKDKAFIADEAYILEMKKVEAALMLSAARARKQGGH